MASESDSFCSLVDVQGLVQRGAFTQYPTPDEVLTFMARRSARVEAALRASGFVYTVPAGSNPFSATPSGDEERVLKSAAEEAAASGAAADALVAQTIHEGVDVPERAGYLEKQFASALEAIAQVRSSDLTSGSAPLLTGPTAVRDTEYPSTEW